MGIGAAILVVAGLAIFGSGKKNDSGTTAPPQATDASAVVESSAPEISTVSNAHVLASDAAVTTGGASALSQAQPMVAVQPPQTTGASSPSEVAAGEIGRDDGALNSRNNPSSADGASAVPSAADAQPAMLQREHH
ncbi:hypothetical protein [Paraburkholderia sp. BL6669N2]|uniref:hypothetical protein n=1 Tax=Paraburkholderia sp. BL6669N2 TaxID=1938807 RepID=UPI0011C03FE7|nr:hypothetical protein [Paraburkholderia sp. BL6669N2]